MKQITITLKDDNQLAVTASEAIDFPTMLDLTLSAVLAMLNSTVEHTPKQHKQDVKQLLFDSFNQAASTVLAQFAPEIDLRPDITEEAIFQAELNLLPKYMNKDDDKCEQ